MLERVDTSKYPGRLLLSENSDCPSVDGNLWKARRKRGGSPACFPVGGRPLEVWDVLNFIGEICPDVWVIDLGGKVPYP